MKRSVCGRYAGEKAICSAEQAAACSAEAEAKQWQHCRAVLDGGHAPCRPPSGRPVGTVPGGKVPRAVRRIARPVLQPVQALWVALALAVDDALAGAHERPDRAHAEQQKEVHRTRAPLCRHLSL